MVTSDRTGNASPLEGFGCRILDASLAAVVVSQIIYVFTFDRLANAFRLSVAGELFAVPILVSTWALISRPAPWSALIAVVIAINLISWSVTPFAGVAAAVSSAEPTRILACELVPYAAAIWTLTAAVHLLHRLMYVAMLASGILANALDVAGKPVPIPGSVRYSSLTGGKHKLDLHSSTCVISLAAFIADACRRTSWALGTVRIAILDSVASLRRGSTPPSSARSRTAWAPADGRYRS